MKGLRADWEEVKVDVMYKAINAKFTQNEDLKKRLLATKDMELLEDSKWDKFWGINKKDEGKNMLGKLLVKLRTELR